MELAKGELTFNDDLVVGPQILGDTSASAWVANLTDHLVLEIGYGSKNGRDVTLMMMTELEIFVLMVLEMFMHWIF